MSAGRIKLLEERLSARAGKPGFKRNVVALKAELAKLKSPTPKPHKTAGPKGA